MYLLNILFYLYIPPNSFVGQKDDHLHKDRYAYIYIYHLYSPGCFSFWSSSFGRESCQKKKQKIRRVRLNQKMRRVRLKAFWGLEQCGVYQMFELI